MLQLPVVWRWGWCLLGPQCPRHTEKVEGKTRNLHAPEMLQAGCSCFKTGGKRKKEERKRTHKVRFFLKNHCNKDKLSRLSWRKSLSKGSSPRPLPVGRSPRCFSPSHFVWKHLQGERPGTRDSGRGASHMAGARRGSGLCWASTGGFSPVFADTLASPPAAPATACLRE